ncbi:MAG: acylneuraminate cytidylyltransferase family protein [Clostridia bacterium]|nr:acylneuraminate cytidylyltransferase family protein [Clostridia bacterium]
MKIVACVPIKLNNERCPGKNTRPLGDKPLIGHVLETLDSVKELDEVYVFCSDDEIQKYLTGRAVHLKRPAYLDEPTSNFTQIFREFMNRVDADIYLYAHATAPFITKETMEECIEKVKSGEYDSAFTAVVIQDFLWQDGKPMNFDARNLPRSQDLKKIYRETSGVYAFTKEVFEKIVRRVGEKPYIKEVSQREAVDINTESDFEFAQMMIELGR